MPPNALFWAFPYDEMSHEVYPLDDRGRIGTM